MLDRVFLLAMEEGPAACARVTVNNRRMKFLQSAPAQMEQLWAWSGYDSPVEVTFVDSWGVEFLNVPDAEALDYETIEALYEGSNVMLGTPLVAGCYSAVPTVRDVVMIFSEYGVRWRSRTRDGEFPLETKQLLWAELGIDGKENRRCRDMDCAEGHPVAGELELVTCLQCRTEMKL